MTKGKSDFDGHNDFRAARVKRTATRLTRALVGCFPTRSQKCRIAQVPAERPAPNQTQIDRYGLNQH